MAAAIMWTGRAETVTNVRGSQRPNSNLVDIYYDLNAVDGWSYTVEVAIEGCTNEVTATTFSGDVGEGIAPGKNHHIVWEAGADWRGNKGDVKAAVTATGETREGKPKMVQLWEGGPYWADRNIGADAPWDYGLYFWWGDTIGHRPSGMAFDFDFYYKNSAIYTYGKIVLELQSAGWMTSDGVIAPSHDAAHVKWGGGWRIPTSQELSDLISKCVWTWVTMNGVHGYVVCGTDGYASNSIFLPCAGMGERTSLRSDGSFGYYWSSVPDSDCDIKNSWALYFYSRYPYMVQSGNRAAGMSIRPVQGFAK